MKETLKLVFVLTVICAVSSALLAAVYDKTKGPIAATLEKRTADAAAGVMPEGVAMPEKVEIDGTEFFVSKGAQGIAAVAVEGVSKNGYGGEIKLMVGLGSDGKLVNFAVVQASETPGLGTKISDDAFRSQLAGKPLAGTNWKVSKDGGEIDAVTAATISSRAALECVRDAIGKYERAAAALMK